MAKPSLPNDSDSGECGQSGVDGHRCGNDPASKTSGHPAHPGNGTAHATQRSAASPSSQVPCRKKGGGNRSTDPLTYTSAGVDIDAGDKAANLIQRHMHSTYGPRVLGRHGAFAGCFRLDFNEKLFQQNYRDPVLVSCTDGVGSKVLLASQLGILDMIGQDVVAMNVNDMIVQGAEPLFFLDYIGIHKVEPERIARIVEGVAAACRQAGCALLGGETAELPDLYKPGDFDLAGFAVGVCELRRMIDGSRAEKGDVILGLAASGVHSNGFSLVRAVIEEVGLDLDKIYPQLNEVRTLGQVLLTPTRIYVRPVISVLRRYRVKKVVSAMSHITGGGLPGNVPRTLGSHINARIDLGSWPVPPIFQFLQQQGRIEDNEMFRVFNMGIGFVLVVRPYYVESIRQRLQRAGEQVAVIGRIERGTGRLLLA